jgi:hypothetical protein
VKLPLEVRWGQDIGSGVCFVCGLAVSRTDGWITGLDTRDRHSRQAHVWCWKLVLRYAQCVLDAQVKGEVPACQST